MSCDSVLKLIPLYYYGEIPPEEEDLVESHLDECPSCAAELERHRALAAALDAQRMEIPAGLLSECRGDLRAAVEGGAPLLRREREKMSKGPWELFVEALQHTFGTVRIAQPLGAMALVAVGFFAARFTGAIPGINAPAAGAPMAEDVFATVRSVQPDATGRVRIAFDETRRREISGSMQDENVRRLLLAAAHEENTAVRSESMDLLKAHSSSADVRDALLNALEHDANAGVRLKALDGLKPLAGDPQVRKALLQVLQGDENPAVRMQAVDLLAASPDDSMVGVFQNVVQKEDNSAVRLKCEKALKDMNASIGIF